MQECLLLNISQPLIRAPRWVVGVRWTAPARIPSQSPSSPPTIWANERHGLVCLGESLGATHHKWLGAGHTPQHRDSIGLRRPWPPVASAELHLDHHIPDTPFHCASLGRAPAVRITRVLTLGRARAGPGRSDGRSVTIASRPLIPCHPYYYSHGENGCSRFSVRQHPASATDRHPSSLQPEDRGFVSYIRRNALVLARYGYQY